LNETPLHLAAKLESCSINKFEALLSRIDPEKVLNIADHFGYTPLHYAVDVRLPNEKKIKLLLDKGADINSKTKKGYTALHFALWHKSATVTMELLSHVKLVDGKDVEDADVNSMDDYNQTALHYACWWSGIPVGLFKIILEKTTDMNGKDQLGYTGLIIALFVKTKSPRKNC
jgi:ankyrin repeat protein